MHQVNKEKKEDAMMKKIFEKHETMLVIGLIILYLVMNSFCLKNFGTTDYRSAIINTLFSVAIICLIVSAKRTSYYGLNGVRDLKKYLYFFPLLLLASVNLWNGIHMDNTIQEILFHVITMINVGFLEEILFRGFLFKMMEKDSLKIAMIVSALTFGIGHIINLFTGAEFIPTLLQVCYATSIGFLFVVIFYKSKSLVPCIVTHALINVLSIFNGENEKFLYAGSIFLIIVPAIYAIYIWKTTKENSESV